MNQPPKSSGNFSGVLWGALAFFVVMTLYKPDPSQKPTDPFATSGQSPSATATTAGSSGTKLPAGTEVKPVDKPVDKPVAEKYPAAEITLEDDRRTLVLTSAGAAVLDCTLKINDTAAIRGHSHELLKPFQLSRPHFGTAVEGLGVDLRKVNWRVLSHSPEDATFVYEAGSVIVKKTIRLGESYLVDVNVTVEGLEEAQIEQDSASGFEDAGQSGVQLGGTYFLDSMFIADRESGSTILFDADFGDLEDHDPGNLLDSHEDDGIMGLKLAWVGHRDSYFVSVMRSDEPAVGVLGLVGRDGEDTPSGMRAGLRIKGSSLTTTTFLGPKHHGSLESIDPKLTQMFKGGILGPIKSLLLFILETLYSLVKSYGIAIILLTLVVRLGIHPLSRRGQLKMAIYQEKIAKIQPKLNQLKKKHEGDRHAFAQAQMKLMRDNKISGGMMLGGCLPLFLQMPIFLSLYYMLQENIELRGTQFLWITDMSLPDRLMELPFFPGEFNLLPLMTLAVTVIQMKRSMNRNQTKMTPEQEATQKMMLFLMPGIMIIFTYTFAAGLLLYWFTSALFGILESEIMRRKIATMKASGQIT